MLSLRIFSNFYIIGKKDCHPGVELPQFLSSDVIALKHRFGLIRRRSKCALPSNLSQKLTHDDFTTMQGLDRAGESLIPEGVDVEDSCLQRLSI